MEQIPSEESSKRPQFLTVLCILTYIGTGVGLLFSIVGWWGMQRMSEMMANPDMMMEGMPGMDMDKMEQMMVLIKYSNVLLISGVAGCLICLLGALQMWKQKKTGFYIYAVGEAGPVIVSTVCLGAEAFKGWNLVGFIVPVVFLVLYGLNLKHMN